MSIEQQKWRKFLSRIWLFKFIPFVDFVLASGSLATGNMNENSDFDVIVGVRQGRIFTARAFCILGFGFFGWRRKGNSDTKLQMHANLRTPSLFRRFASIRSFASVSDKFCFNHFITPSAYRLSEPHNDYWKKLYSSLAPVYGEPEVIQKFFKANSDWTYKSYETYSTYKSYKNNRSGLPAKFFELLLSGWLGNWAEQWLKSIQIKRIEKSLKTAELYHPRLIYNDNELEFHPHTKRIEEHLRGI